MNSSTMERTRPAGDLDEYAELASPAGVAWALIGALVGASVGAVVARLVKRRSVREG